MEKRLFALYELLIGRFGEQGWWPLSGLNYHAKNNDKDFLNFKKVNSMGTDFQKSLVGEKL